ncbi:TetR/AcrR family transcriptional regulator [Peterkaempfera sp. SMS 1(5)a]|uniref:TetR/AcrR family transcriptional regulator n=1 Tax=Peterkaempfera podocarpi TaxID=3232308 RepID=UPI0036707713
MAQQRTTPAPTRERILDAADRLLRTIGLARATTKEIARAAGCSEAALYKHFRGKEEIFVAVLHERLPSLGPLPAELPEESAVHTLEQCLTGIARRAALFYEATMPIGASLFAEPGLLQRHREALRELDAGPHKPLLAVADHLRDEQLRGRVRADADCDAAAALLLGACFQRAFLLHFNGAGEEGPQQPEPEGFAAALARTVLRGIAAGTAG